MYAHIIVYPRAIYVIVHLLCGACPQIFLSDILLIFVKIRVDRRRKKIPPKSINKDLNKIKLSYSSFLD